MYNFFDAIKNNLSTECLTAIQIFSELSEIDRHNFIFNDINRKETFIRHINNVEFIFNQELINCKDSMVKIKDKDVIIHYDVSKGKMICIDIELQNKDDEKTLFSFYYQKNVDFAVYGNILGKPYIQYSEKLEFLTQVNNATYNEIYLIVNNLDKTQNEMIDLIKIFTDKQMNEEMITFYKMLSFIKNKFQLNYHSKLVL